ncbi:MAG: uroporphyrinogen decarboxylase family protein [Bacteroidales bacterium]
MTSRELVNASMNHKDTGKIAVDFGSTGVTGIHVLAVKKLRDYYGLESKPVKVVEPYQMLGEIEEDLAEIMAIDVMGIGGPDNMFGFANENWKEFKTFWGQEVLVPENFNTSFDENGDLLLYPAGDTSVAPSAKMPKSSYFFDAIIRQKPLEEDHLNVEDNLEEFSVFDDKTVAHWKKQAKSIEGTDKAIVANMGGTGLGDIALVPGLMLKDPRGIRDVAEWYMSTVMRQDYVHQVFEKQTDIAIKNLEILAPILGDKIDVMYMCGTDFGTQDSTFCAPEAFRELWMPYYQKMNNWIHENTSWKTFKHSCGAVEPFIQLFIEAGFDIINPVQINAKGMNPVLLKEKYGDKVTFWGGGVDTQKVLAFGTPGEVSEQVKRQCEILGKNGGFVFNTIHNVQANVPADNLVAMVETYKKFR